MSYFVKPTQIEVNVTLHKDLCEGEEICQTCKGMGIIVVDNNYGFVSDSKNRIRFPYVKQSFAFCPNCYNGVIKRCSLCGEIIPRIELNIIVRSNRKW